MSVHELLNVVLANEEEDKDNLAELDSQFRVAKLKVITSTTLTSKSIQIRNGMCQKKIQLPNWRNRKCGPSPYKKKEKVHG